MGSCQQQQQQQDLQEWELQGRSRASRLNRTLHSLPVHCLTDEDLQLERTKGLWQHFHRPNNSHNRFLASLTQQERAILRAIERLPPYNSRTCTPGMDAPAQQHSAGDLRSIDSSRSSGRQRAQPAAAVQSGRQMTCMDLLTGQPATAHIRKTQPWRVAMVRSYVAAPGSSHGPCPAQARANMRAKHRAPAVCYQYCGPCSPTLTC